MKIKLKEYGLKPIRAHETDAGMDLRSPVRAVVPPRGYVSISTGVCVELPGGCCGLLVSKSGLNTKYGLTTTGLIDEGYSGEIVVTIHNESNTAYTIEPGDKISQLVVFPVRYEPIELVDEISAGERGKRGFGSTGK